MCTLRGMRESRALRDRGGVVVVVGVVVAVVVVGAALKDEGDGG